MTKIYGYGVREKLANYASALEGCGAECVFSLDVEEALDCQGLLLPGGGDIDPARYGQPSAGSEAPDLQRDAAELELVSRFLAWGRPILGICRGIQLLNVALGGDLIQDIPTAADHKHDAALGDRVHGVEAAPGSFLEGLYGSAFPVNSAHHQALGQVAPGLRVAAAKALPAFDPEEPTGVSRLPTVTVVAVPAGAGERPLPDRRFLAAVQARLDRLRPIGTRVKVIPPVYVELTVRVSLRGSEDGVERTLEEALRSFLEGCGIGGVLRAGDIAALVQAAPGVLQVRRVDLRTTAPGCYQNADGDIRLPRQAIPRLRELQVERLPVERIGH